MDYSQLLLNCLNNLNGTIKKRSIALRDLKLYLDERRVLNLLNQNSKANAERQNRTTWQDVFNACHTLALTIDSEMEADKHSKAKLESRESTINLIAIIASKANRDPTSPNLDLISTLNICLDVLKKERWSVIDKQCKQLGKVYLNILAKNILQLKHYWHLMKLEQWQKLCDFCMDSYGTVPTSVKGEIVEILEVVVNRGSSQSPLAIHVMKRLDFFEKIFEVEQLDRHSTLKVLILKLLNVVFMKSALESRQALCKLGEKIIGQVMRYQPKADMENERRSNQNQNVFYDLLLIIVCLHHPGGSAEGEEGSLAHDWTLWKKMLRELRSLVDEDLKTFSEIRGQGFRGRGSGVLPEMLPSLLCLTVEVYKQTLDIAGFDETSLAQASTSSYQINSSTVEGGPSKRRRLEVGVALLTDQLRGAKRQEETAVRLRVITALLTKYPKLVSSGDYVELLQLVTNIQSSCKNVCVMRHLFSCCESLLACESHFVFSKNERGAVNQLWDKIWDMAVRAAGLNQCEAGCHSLLQTLLQGPRGPSMRHIPLLRLLSSGVAILSADSIKTLTVLAQTRHLPSVQDVVLNMSSISMSQGFEDGPVSLIETLLRWLLPCHEEDTDEDTKTSNIPSEILAEALVRLTLASHSPPSMKTPEVEALIQPRQRIEEVYQLGVFHLSSHSDSKEINLENLSQISVQINVTTLNLLYNLLQAEFEFVIEKLGSLMKGSKLIERFATLLLLIQDIGIFAHVLSFMLKWNMINESEVEQHALTQSLKELLRKLSKSLNCILEHNAHIGINQKHISVLFALDALYKGDYHPLINNILRYDDKLLICLLNDTKSSDPNYEKDDDFSDMMIESGSLYSITSNSTPTHHTVGNPLSFLSDKNLSYAKLRLLWCVQVLARFYFPLQSDHWPSKSEASETLLSFAQDLAKVPGERINSIRIVNILHKASLSLSLTSKQVACIEETLKNLIILKQTDQNYALIILNTLYNILPHLKENTSDLDKENRTLAVQILNGFSRLVAWNNFGPEVKTSLINCFGKCIEVDPDQTWFLWTNKEKEQTPIAADILDFLKDDYYEVRLSAASYIKPLFCSVGPNWELSKKRKWHRLVFEKLCIATMKSFDSKSSDNISPEVQNDKHSNLTLTALQSYATVILTNPKWRKKALFAIFQQAKLRKMDCVLVKKFLDFICQELKVASIKKFLGASLTFILNQWLRQNYDLSEFPWQLFDCSSEEEFYRIFKRQIIFTLLRSPNNQPLTYVCNQLNQTLHKIIEECYPELMSFLLPYMNNDAPPSHANDTILVKEKMIQVLGRDGLSERLGMEIDKIIVCLFLHLHDTNHWQEFVGPNVVLDFTQPDSPYIELENITRTFEYIQSLHEESNKPLFALMSQESPSSIEHMLQRLSVCVHEAPTIEDCLEAFLQYSVFVDLLAQQLDGKKLGRLTKFVVRNIIYMLTNFLANERAKNEAIAISICVTLKKFSFKCINYCLCDFEQFFPVVINTLISTVKSHPCDTVCTKALQVIKFFIEENRYILKTSIEKLEPFPSGSQFEEIQNTFQEVKYDMKEFSLEDEIVHFLNAGKSGHRAEGLIHIRSQLALKKHELKILYDDLHFLRGFSEDCAASILHQLVCTLVKLSSDSDKTVSLEAVKCLGELGPADLTTLVLEPEQSIEAASPDLALCQKKLELLKNYLVDPNISIATAASAALYSLLKTKAGYQALMTIQDQEYLEPFKAKGARNVTASLRIIDEDTFVQKLADSEIWCPSLPIQYKDWISRLVSAILSTISYNPELLEHIEAVCNAKEDFSAELLPRLVYFIITTDNNFALNLIEEKLNLFFAKHYEANESGQSSLDSNFKFKKNMIYFDKKSVNCMLNVVQFIRAQEHGSRSRMTSEAFLDLNYLHVARAAQFCSAYFSSIFYAELWGMKTKLHPTSSSFVSIDDICDGSDNGKALHEILLTAYKSIGDPDAVYGCGMTRLLDTKSKIWYFEHCAKWDKVLLLNDIDATGNAPSRGMAMALQHSGLDHLLKSYLSSQESEEMKAMSYECCWRLGQWDLPSTAEVCTSQTSSNIHSNFQAHHYSALKALQTSDFCSLQEEIKNARNSITSVLSNVCLESSNNLYDALSKLQILQELQDISSVVEKKSDSLSDVLEKWKQQDKIPIAQFEYCEPILSQRACLLDLAFNKGVGEEEILAERLLDLSKVSQQEKWFHVSERALRKLSQLGDRLGGLFELKRRFQEAKNLWEQGTCDMGQHLLSAILSDLAQLRGGGSTEHKMLNAAALRLKGSWLVETRSENAQNIIENYLFAAIQVLHKLPHDQEKRFEAYYSLARFADLEFQRVNKYMKSPMFESKLQCLQHSEEDVQNFKKENAKTKDTLRAINFNDKQCQLDRIEINNTTQEKAMHLQLALQYHLLSLENAVKDEGDSSMFRLVTLWLDNRSDLHENKDTSKILEKALKQGGLPSHKFLPVVTQLVPHISKLKQPFDLTLSALLERLAENHPHHVLPTLLALALLHEDVPYLAQGGVSKAKIQPEPRVIAAHEMLQRLCKKPKLGEIITQMETAAKALIKLAYYTQETKAKSEIPSGQPILKIKNFDKMQISTLDLPVDVTGNYNNIIGVHSYEKQYFLVGGINAPKRIICTGTDGIKRTQLLKGLDDLHQDAVMQQVFTIMNSLLRRNKRTRERGLLVRTYKVVPLSQRSGLIEWCENSQPIGGYLMKAHPAYHPEDDTPLACRTKMENVIREKHERRLQTYLGICRKFKPVFHNFFTENFPQPGVWFERRLAYTRSVATTSMIGYVLGIGDRHVQNILVDKSTAEIIHIDFGIAFEQGLVLTVPETVPFRLSRDIEDGFGISGVEGVFRRCCEETMSLLRDNQETLLTILQVLLYDPLYAWTISPEKNQNNRKGMKGARDAAASEVEVNKLAERALLRLQHKLMGTEEGNPTSVAGQVNRLIQQARDPQNLSRLFYGWQPYL